MALISWLRLRGKLSVAADGVGDERFAAVTTITNVTTPSLIRPLDAAKIRAFFVHPEHAGQGIAKLILARCEADAIEYGFLRFELMATLPAVPFYAAQGFEQAAPISHSHGHGLTIEFVPMNKVAP